MEGAASANLALDPKQPIMEFNDLFANGQSDPQSTYFFDQRCIGAIEALKDLLQMSACNTNSLVLYPDL